MQHLPGYDELPVTRGAPAHSAWGLFGADDRLGTLNLINAATISAAAKLVRHGRVFRLDLPLDAISPGLMGRTPPVHHVWSKGDGTASDDYIDRFYLQGGSQWDALRHIRHSQDRFYNGTAVEDAGQLGIHVFAQRGIVGRGVLLDVARYLEATGTAFDPTAGTVITAEILDACARMQKVDFQTGDILVIRTGWVSWYLNASEAVRADLAARPGHVLSSGIGPVEEMARYLWDHHFAAIATDNIAVEPSGTGGHLHRKVIPHFGLALGELWFLEELAAHCHSDGVFEFFLVSAPLYLPGGVGSPANALAIK